MHPYALVPLLAALGAGALASAVAVRDPRSPAHRLAALLLTAVGLWAFGCFVWNSATRPELTLWASRISCLPALAVCPLALHLLLELIPELDRRYRRWLLPCYGATAACGLIWVTTPWMTTGVTRTSWGWQPVLGPGTAIVTLLVLAVPLAAVAHSLRLHRSSDDPARRRLLWAHVSVVFPLAVAAFSDIALPILEVEAPQLGVAALVVWGGLLWWGIYRFRDPLLSPDRFAREILETLPNGVLLLRVDGTIRLASSRVAELADCDVQDLIGRPIRELLDEGWNDPSAVSDGTLRTRRGEAVPVSVSHAELRDPGGSLIGHALAVHDLREVVSLRGRLVTSGRLAAVGQLAAGIAHEINNPVAYVRSNLGLLEQHWRELEAETGSGGGDDGLAVIAECREGVERIAAIVRDVGGFAEQGPSGWETADLNALLDTALRVAAPQLRSRAHIEKSYAELPRIRCVPRELMQVFLNLVLNAAQACDERGTILLATQRRGNQICVRVEDDGRGLPPGDPARLFEAFYTTKPAGQGTGLGLAISSQIVNRHGGDLGAKRRPGGGSIFWLRLPVAGPAAA